MNLPPRKYRYRTFVSDKDGLSQKDFLLIISVGVFFLFVSVGLFMILVNKRLDEMYLELLDIVTPVVIGVTTGIFGVQITQEIRKPRGDPTVSESEQAEEVYENYDDEGRI
ncbi:hypothetical protein V1503_18765 [Bacillus sp. SCS-151]|uniref:hypothetical protein n=1 Tax=Nanhaiella sioensis TaxID=3115293 RepID=UPI00397A96DF